MADQAANNVNIVLDLVEQALLEAKEDPGIDTIQKRNLKKTLLK